MQGISDLASAFLAHMKVRLVPSPDAAELAHLLRRAWEDARAKWPGVALSPEPFVKHLAERLPAKTPADPIGPLLESLALADLYLACACLHGVPAAIAAFEHHYLPKLRKHLARRERSAAALDEICQLTRVKILVPTAEGPPKIADYTGVGSLLGWARSTASRISLRQREAEKPGTGDDPDKILDMLPEPGAAPDMDVIRQRHHEDLRQAMHEAFAKLSEDDRHLLRLHHAERLSTYKLMPLYRVSQPTLSRRLKAAREQVLEETRRLLQERLGLSQHEFLSFMKLIDSQFDVRISQLLGQAPSRVR